MESAPTPASAPGRADLPPPSNGPTIALGPPGMHSHPVGAPRPPDPPRQLRCRSRPLTARALSSSPLRAADPARLPHLALGPRARVLLRHRCPSVPALPSRAGRAAVRLSWRGSSSGCAAERRARGQLLPPGAAPPPSARPASRTAAGSPAPRAQRPRPRLGGPHGAKGPGCVRSPLSGSLTPAPSPPCHTCTCCGPASSGLR